MADATTHILVRGASEHNLKDLDLDLPRDNLVVITGVSGSGKSSLAFDTIYQEGQRRFLESLSAYARQFLGGMEKPRVTSVEGLSPTLAIDQKGLNRNPRSTVGTVTEILDHLRLWMARLGTPHCPECGREIGATTPAGIADRLLHDHPGARTLVMGPVVKGRKGEHRKELLDLSKDGYTRARVDGVVRPLDEPIELGRYQAHTIEVVVDRLRLRASQRERLLEAVEQAVALGDGVVTVLAGDHHLTFATTMSCPEHGTSVPEMEPRLFSFNTPQGACPGCDGLGVQEGFVPALLLDEDAPPAKCFRAFKDGRMPFFTSVDEDLLSWVAARLGGDPASPLRHQPPDVRQGLLHGAPLTWHPAHNPNKTRRWKGLFPLIERLWRLTRYPPLQEFRTSATCPSCRGARLNPAARSVTSFGRSLPELLSLSVSEAREFFQGLELHGARRLLGEPILGELRHRLRFLEDVGLGYLTLDRRASTLAGGEAQRIRLAAQVGSGLQGVTYILDEPSIGLHPSDNRRLLDTLLALRDQGNTVLVVEHDAETMRAADHLVEIGPGPGRAGGTVTASGDPARFLKAPSITADYLLARRFIPLPATRRRGIGQALVVKAPRAHNLKGMDVSIPLGTLTVVTGVSGSGKSTLLMEILEPALASALQGARRSPLEHDGIEGLEHLDKVIAINQDPIGRTPRSNPATYTGALAGIRQLFAAHPEARARGYAPGRFSFNVPGGRCEECEGAGVRILEMQLLADVTVPCDTCGGRRFNRETLDIRYRGRSITEILEMSVDESLDLFGRHRAIRRPLETLSKVGLGYLSLGQPSTTLSGGEAQRIKLARELQRPPTGRTLYILDEPTTGLHFADVARLLEALQALVEAGNTVVVIEHDTDVIKVADHLLDLGPGGGQEGGQLVGSGTPEEISRLDTPTGLALRSLPELGGVGAALAAEPRPPRPMERDIVIEGARKHNLKGIDVTIPHRSLTVVTGVSGSGKSSLVMHTLFAEGQRRYVESLSTYARRFLGRLERPPVDRIAGLAPAIAVEQRSSGGSPRSTVATVTEIHDLLRLLWSRIGEPECHICGRPILGLDPSRAAHHLATLAPGRGRLLAPLPPSEDCPDARRELLQEGYRRLWDGSSDVPLEDEGALPLLAEGALLVLDRLDPAAAPPQRVADAVAQAYRWGRSRAVFLPVDGHPIPLSLEPECPEHGSVLPGPLTPRHFSFNSRLGACERCDGLGEVTGEPCPTCAGGRLKAPLLAVKVRGLGIQDFTALSVMNAADFVGGMVLDPRERAILAQLLPELQARIGFLRDVGLDYLTLDRRADTLSGGEAQRMRLASQLGSRLTETIYVLDEPTIGLHPRDVGRLLDTLESLRDLGNTVVVVEHDLDTMRRADHLVELGPGAGTEGGQVVVAGTPAEVAAHPASPTGAWLAGRRTQATPPQRRRSRKAPALVLEGAAGRNLDGVDIRIPTEALTVVTGVSGSGKSTLILDTLAPALQRHTGADGPGPLPFGSIKVPPEVRRVVVVDAAPMGRSPRSCPATVARVMDPLRQLFASLPDSQVKGLRPGDFSFNAAGACPLCKGRGHTLVEMHFISDVWVPCEACRGRRYRERVLDARWMGRNIADVLALTVEEAVGLFAHHRALARPLTSLADVGLGYLLLGQPANALSGGEAQRLKLAVELAARGAGNVYILDEPTVGLHPDDVERLLGVLSRLVGKGHTVVVIEHNLQVIRAADLILDLGPGGGDRGGRLVAAGSPDQVAATPGSHTGAALAAHRNHPAL